MVNLRHLMFVLVSLLLSCAFTLSLAAENYTRERANLIRLIEQNVRFTNQYLNKRVLDSRVMAALGKVLRHEFVPQSVRSLAYQNRPLPIGYGQTISQPYIVAIMTDMLETSPAARVLEIGTGSGYQAAILAEMVDQVYTIEIIEALGQRAAQTLSRLGYDNIETRIGDGYYGWAEQAPFDAIVVTAASGYIPPPLIQQLKNGGRMVIPVGSRFLTQQLVIVEKDLTGRIITRQVLPVRFVPLTGNR